MSDDRLLVIMRGPSGAGKSSVFRERYPDAVHCSADNFFIDKETGDYNFNPKQLGIAHSQCSKNCENAMQLNAPVIVVDNTNTRHREFKCYLDLAAKYQYDVKVIRVSCPLEDLLGRNVHGVPDEAVKAMFDRMESYEGEEIVFTG